MHSHRFAFVPLLLALVLPGQGPAAAADPAANGNSIWVDPHKMAIPPLGEIKVPAPERFVLGNGMVIYLLEDHDFPLFDASAMTHLGSMYEPAEKVGLAAIAGQVLRTGGSTSMPGDSLDRKLESMGAKVEISFGITQGTATVSSLSKDADEVLRILGELLQKPAFTEDKLELAKNQERTSIAGRNDEPFDIVFREYLKLVYGPAHPYARHTEYATVNAITRDDLVNFHKEFMHPDRTILTLYGDFDSAKMKKSLDRVFGEWPRSTNSLPADPAMPSGPNPGAFLAAKEDMTNSMVVLGHLSMRMDDPDYAAMALLNEIVGGGGSNRLMDEIRVKRGLAYGAGSYLNAGYHHPGALFFYAATQTDSTAATAGYIRREIDRAITTPVAPEELSRARDRILNSLVFELSSKETALNRIATLDFFGYPKDFLQQYQEAIKKLTAEDLLAAAKRKIHPADMATLVVGVKDNVLPQFAATGGLKELDLSIPESAAPPPPEAAADALPQGQAILAAAVAATGPEALRGLKDFSYELGGTYKLPSSEIKVSRKSVRKFPDCEWAELKLPMGVSNQALCGKKGWMKTNQGVQDMSPEIVQGVLAGRGRDLLVLLSHPEELKARALPNDVSIDGRPASVVSVQSSLVEGWKIYFDKETHLIVRQEYRDRSAGGPKVQMEEIYTDYRDVSGIKWPFARTIRREGQPFAQLTVVSAVANSGIDESVFSKPSK